MEILSRASLFGPSKRRVKSFLLPDGRTAHVRSLTEREWANYSTATLNESGKLKTSRLLDATRRLIVMTLCDESGDPILGVGDVEQLAEVDSATTQAIYNAALDHIGVRKEDVEELVKNSGGTPDEG